MNKESILIKMADAISKIEEVVTEAKALDDKDALWLVYQPRDDMYDGIREYACKNGYDANVYLNKNGYGN